MTVPSPLHALIVAEGAQGPMVRGADAETPLERPGAATGVAPPLEPEWIPWGPEHAGTEPAQLLATGGSIELEYAALRRGAGRLDAVHRGVVRIGGTDRLDLLDRLLTQKVRTLEPGQAAESFLIDRKGRILADLIVVHLDDATWIDVDVHQVAITVSTIEGMCFGEDVDVTDATPAMHRIDVHGPEACALVQSLGFDLSEPLQAAKVGNGAFGWRLDRTGAPGVSLSMPTAAAEATWNALQEAAQGGGCTLRTIGWYAYNMARVEAYEPMANIDFGPGNLPAETGVLDRRVSFDKGCYPGQEVVARMHNLGHPKQILRRLDLPDERLPIAGAQLFAGDDADLGTPVGTITSSAPAPLSSQRAVALAMLRWAAATPGSRVLAMADGQPVPAQVQEIES